jgi:hypothetical protein
VLDMTAFKKPSKSPADPSKFAEDKDLNKKRSGDGGGLMPFYTVND